jgi:Holliday junction DNA helicase RuvA
VYDYLDGDVASFAAARLVLDVGGVGYDLAVPLGSSFPARGRARAYVHLVVRDDAHLLYGFADRDTRELFRLLLSVRGVGPGTAIGILSGLPRLALLEAIVAGDAATLTRVRGIGKKTAEQILLDMRDKAAALGAFKASGGDAHGAALEPRESALIEDATAALVSIGYSEKEAQKSIERVRGSLEPKNSKTTPTKSTITLEELVRAALMG